MVVVAIKLVVIVCGNFRPPLQQPGSLHSAHLPGLCGCVEFQNVLLRRKGLELQASACDVSRGGSSASLVAKPSKGLDVGSMCGLLLPETRDLMCVRFFHTRATSGHKMNSKTEETTKPKFET